MVALVGCRRLPRRSDRTSPANPALQPKHGSSCSARHGIVRALDNRFFCRTGSMLMGAHNRAVDKHFFEIGVTRQLREDLMPNSPPRPAGKTLIGTIPEAELRRQVAPRAAGTGDPEHRFDRQTSDCPPRSDRGRCACLAASLRSARTDHPATNDAPSRSPPKGQDMTINRAG